VLEFADYQPGLETQQLICQVDFAAIMGPTASGKSSLILEVQQLGLADIHLVPTNTSRELRPGERPGIDVIPSTEAEMRRRIAAGEYAQVAPRTFGGIYATAPENYRTGKLCVMPVIFEALPAFQALPFNSLLPVYVMPPSGEEWNRRIIKHNFTAPEAEKRMAEARRSLAFAATHELAFVIADQLETAVQEFTAVLHGQTPQLSVNEGQAHARYLLSQLT